MSSRYRGEMVGAQPYIGVGLVCHVGLSIKRLVRSSCVLKIPGNILKLFKF